MRLPLIIPAALITLTLPVALCAQAGPTPQEAEAFLDAAERQLAESAVGSARAAWVAANFITEDTEILSADAQAGFGQLVQELATAAAAYDDVALTPELQRRFLRLKLQLAAPPPANPEKGREMTRLQVGIESDYGRGTYCRPGADGTEECRQLDALSRTLAQSRDPDELLDAWAGWRTIAPPMRDRYARFVELANDGARTLGFSDVGAMWRAGYDMPPADFTAELERLWQQVRPLYLSLHAYVRARLVERYGPELVPPDGMIPAHLLGNMWAQEWGNIYPLVAAAGTEAQTVDVSAILQEREIDAREIVRIGERFFLSLGFDSLPSTFWTRSLFTKPQDREVVCHASAWDIDGQEDIRIKMCIEPTAEDFVTVHHELGHNIYQRAYREQPFLYQDGAHDGFHEAIGDAIALSTTPQYLVDIGLLDAAPSAAADTALLLRQALDKVAFLPFGLLMDRWRWAVFAGEVTPDTYNSAWWELRNRYQGVAAPVARGPDAFDPGAKYHIPANTPYTRYFLAAVLQFQFYKALCDAAGHDGPLYRCSFFGSEEAGRRFAAMMAMGASRPWQDALEALTGQRQMDGSALLEYFAPLQTWLDAQNRGVAVGW